MKTAIIIIAVCEVIRTTQITLDLIMTAKARQATLESINKVGSSVADDFKPDKIASAIVKEVTSENPK